MDVAAAAAAAPAGALSFSLSTNAIISGPFHGRTNDRDIALGLAETIDTVISDETVQPAQPETIGEALPAAAQEDAQMDPANRRKRDLDATQEPSEDVQPPPSLRWNAGAPVESALQATAMGGRRTETPSESTEMVQFGENETAENANQGQDGVLMQGKREVWENNDD